MYISLSIDASLYWNAPSGSLNWFLSKFFERETSHIALCPRSISTWSDCLSGLWKCLTCGDLVLIQFYFACRYISCHGKQELCFLYNIFCKKKTRKELAKYSHPNILSVIRMAKSATLVPCFIRSQVCWLHVFNTCILVYYCPCFELLKFYQKNM